MELFGKEYNVNKKIIKKRMGKLPCTDIEKVEKQIQSIEKEFKENKNINMEMVHRLMRMYQTSVEYYSAINSPKFEIYTNKMSRPLLIGGRTDAYVQTFRIDSDGTTTIEKFGWRMTRSRWSFSGTVEKTE